ncbi:hypothetical protein JMJ35_006601 [Cladonia borealis]|uniref:Uncharacterized protein n=1 Tax=Cladonia borealis TaxID=184061 RepID=A0AA39V4B4_9LECA|nr:hypothetical protein JMJ35_006601 [Cladonia borealis]
MYLAERSTAKKEVAEANLEPQMRSDASLDLEASLHQPAEDNSIVADFTSLRGYIESHTLEFYHSEPVQIDVVELRFELEEILPSVPVASIETLARVLLQPESRPAGIRAIIAHMLFASIDFYGDSERTILPPLAIAHMSTFNKSRDWTAEMQPVYQHALSKWRVLSTFLLSAPDGRPRRIAPGVLRFGPSKYKG